MSFFLIILLLAVLALLATHFYLARGENLSRYDGVLGVAALRQFRRPGGQPSAAHEGVVAALRKNGTDIDSLTKGAMVRFVRQFMEDIQVGRRFDCEFRPVTAAGVPCEWVIAPGAEPGRRVLYLHGGAFFAGSPGSHRSATCRFSEVARAAVLSVDYRLIPENTRRDGIQDCRAAYRWLLENGPDGPGAADRVYVGGDSAGGNLALMLNAWARDSGLRQADAVVAFSPVTDCTFSSPSVIGNFETDLFLQNLLGRLVRLPRFLFPWIAWRVNQRRPVDPEVSPVFGDLSGLPPTLLQASDCEMLLDDARRYVAKARSQGTAARLQCWSGVVHVWQLFYPEVPEAREAWQQVGEFIAEVDRAG